MWGCRTLDSALVAAARFWFPPWLFMMAATLRFWKPPTTFFYGIAIFAGALLADPPLKTVNITVRVYDWVHVEPATVAAAESEAARIFKQAGVGLVWLNCAGSASESDLDPICLQVLSFGPIGLADCCRYSGGPWEHIARRRIQRDRHLRKHFLEACR